MVVAPNVLAESQRVKLSDVCVGEESGWRMLDRARVAELKDQFRKGLYGINLLTRPKLLKAHGNFIISPKDGKNLLLDGKHTFVALNELASQYIAEADADEATDDGKTDSDVWSALLVEALTLGVLVDFVEFSDPEDADLRVAYCVQAHDEEANKYKKTSLRDLVGVALRYKAREPGGTWAATQTKLLSIYGAGRRTWIYRMIVAADTLPPSVLCALEEAQIPNSYIHENKFFSGQGSDRPKRLTDEGRLAAVAIYKEEALNGFAFSKKSFVDEICSPLRHAEAWIKNKRNDYGVLAKSPAFDRVADFLMSGRARLQILSCMKLGLRLEGTGPDHMGVEQCYILIKDLEATRRSAVAAAAGDVAAAGDLEAKAAAAAAGDGQMESTGSGILLAGLEAEDTAMTAAVTKTDAVMNRFNYYDSVEMVGAQLNPILHKGSRVVILLDCGTSKSRVVLQHLTEIGQFLAQNGHGQAGGSPLKVRLIVPVLNRYDLVHAVGSKLATECPSLEKYTVMLTCGPAQKRRRQQTAWVCVDKESHKTMNIPNAIDALACRAKAREGVRLRCLDRLCPLRSVTEQMAMAVTQSGGKDKENVEIHEDHCEVGIDDVGEEDDSDAEGRKEEIIMPPSDRACIRDLWPFAYGREF